VVVEPISLGYQTDLALLRLGGSRFEDRGDHLVVRSPHNPTHWWGNYLLVAQVPTPETSQGWLDRFAAEFPTAEHVALGFDGTQSTVAELSWFAERGFGTEAAVVMTATAAREPQKLNKEATCRELRSDDDWAQSIELRMRCNDHPVDPFGHRAYVTAKAQTDRQVVGAGHGAWFGAFIDGALVSQMGLIAAGPGLARFQAVETDPDYRRRGLAGTLVYHVSGYGLANLGARTLVMVADPDYFAIDLYRSVGFAARETQLQIERPPKVGDTLTG
jgi:ribosomal protein S18 acetylase RimI-like enzyme